MTFNEFAYILSNGLMFIVLTIVTVLSIYGLYINLRKKEYKFSLFLLAILLFCAFAVCIQIIEIQSVWTKFN